MIHFLLTPDTASALKLKRLVAEKGGRTDVIAGAWPELLVHARNSCILPLDNADWQTLLAEGVDKLKDAFWGKSYGNVKDEEKKSIIGIIGEHLVMLLEAAGPDGKIDGLERLEGTVRLQRHIRDLMALHNAMGCMLPPQLSTIQQIVQAPPERRLRSMRVYHTGEWLHLNRWQEALIAHLNATATEGEETVLKTCLDAAVTRAEGKSGSGLRYIQEELFTLPEKIALDDTLQWLVVRDYLQEAEVAAGMIQKALADDPTLNPADIALLLPADQHYSHAVRPVFELAGLPVSGLHDAYNSRDLGGEAVLNLLLSLNKPAPVIALASLLSSPLMPWDNGVGNSFAQKIVELRFDLHEPDKFNADQSRMLLLLRERVDKPVELKERLKHFPALLNRDEALDEHRFRAEQLCKKLLGLLEHTETIPWPLLKARAVPQTLIAPTTSTATREGIAVFYEQAEPWRKVKRLFVLGCFDGHYPMTPAGSIIFTDSDLLQLHEKLGLQLETTKERNGRQRELFKRQISAATDNITFFVPSRDALGKPLSPSASLTFAGALFAGDGGAERLLVNLESNTERKKARGLALAAATAPEPPRELLKQDLSFGRNLLEICPNEDGTPKSETPSRLETLMVSPLAWLLERLKVKPREWEPETLTVMTKGTLAHNVFEHLFAPGELPSADTIKNRLPELLDNSVRKITPFLDRHEWKVEREHLGQEILKAALQWREILDKIDATVVATEISLQGKHDDLPVNGNADLLLKSGDRLVVVDYKKSGSTTRRERMTLGYDHQAELYREMIITGGAKEPAKISKEALEELEHFKNAGQIGTLYYLMNDQTVLANTKGWLTNIGGVEEIHNNTSVKAMELIGTRINELKSGAIILNSETDEKDCLENKGIKAYALDSSPLIKLFMKQVELPAEFSTTTTPREDSNEQN
ncbi:MAG: PD-(D/E)XK nuclease family protein [Chlorobiaceae bacterium]